MGVMSRKEAVDKTIKIMRQVSPKGMGPMFDFAEKVVAPALDDIPSATVEVLQHFSEPRNEPGAVSESLQDGEKDEDRIYVIFYPAKKSLAGGPTGHAALMYHGKTVDLYPENIGLESTGSLRNALSVVAFGGSKRKEDTRDGTLHTSLQGDARVLAISQTQLQEFYMAHFQMTEDEARHQVETLGDRIDDIREKRDGWRNWLVLGNQKSGNCVDGVRYTLGLNRENTTFLHQKDGLALPPTLYRYLLRNMVIPGFATRVTPEYYTRAEQSLMRQQNSSSQAQSFVSTMSKANMVGARRIK